MIIDLHFNSDYNKLYKGLNFYILYLEPLLEFFCDCIMNRKIFFKPQNIIAISAN